MIFICETVDFTTGPVIRDLPDSAALSLSSSEKLFRVTELAPLLYSLFTLSVGGSLAFGLGFSEFLLVSRTSSLTLSISGIFKVLGGEKNAALTVAARFLSKLDHCIIRYKPKSKL